MFMQCERACQFSENDWSTLSSMLELRLGNGYPRSHTSSVQAQDSAIYILIPMARRRPKAPRTSGVPELPGVSLLELNLVCPSTIQ